MYGSDTLAIVESSDCMTLAVMMQAVSRPRCGTLSVAPLIGRLSGDQVGEMPDMAGVDIDDHAHPRAQFGVAGPAVDAHPQRDALHHLHPVSGRVLRRQHGEFGAAGGGGA